MTRPLPLGGLLAEPALFSALTPLLIAAALLVTGAGAYSLAGALPPALRKL